jgi:hypothetical protein
VLMGPSGAGKTTLMNILAARQQWGSGGGNKSTNKSTGSAGNKSTGNAGNKGGSNKGSTGSSNAVPRTGVHLQGRIQVNGETMFQRGDAGGSGSSSNSGRGSGNNRSNGSGSKKHFAALAEVHDHALKGYPYGKGDEDSNGNILSLLINDTGLSLKF